MTRKRKTHSAAFKAQVALAALKQDKTVPAAADRRAAHRPAGLRHRRMTIWLQGRGHAVNRKRVQRLMRLMGLEAVYPKPKLSAPGSEHRLPCAVTRRCRS